MFFWERGIRIVKVSGLVGLLSDINFSTDAFEGIRIYILKNTTIWLLVTDLVQFKAVSSGQIFLTVLKLNSNQYSFNVGLNSFSKLMRREVSLDKHGNNFFIEQQEASLLDGSVHHLSDYCSISAGVNIGGAREFFLTKNAQLNSIPFVQKISSKFSDVDTKGMFINFSHKLVDQVNKLNASRGNNSRVVLGSLSRFTGEKIFIRQSASELIATYSNVPAVCSYSFFVLSMKEGVPFSIFYVLGLLNSSQYTKYALEKGIIKVAAGKQPQIRKSGLSQLPFPLPKNPERVKHLVAHVKEIVFGQSAFSQVDLDSLVEKIIENS